MKSHISTTINGDSVEFLCDPSQTLLQVLRNDLGMTGTKEGCGSGDCGACSVILDGELVCACLVLGVEAQDAAIETVEGVAAHDQLHVIQEKFLEHAALQCGICTLLEENPSPTEEEARYFLAGNLCRCTGYDKIIKAVMDAAATMRQGA